MVSVAPAVAPVAAPSPFHRGNEAPSHLERARRTEALLARAGSAEDADGRRQLLNEVVELNCRVADAVAMRHRDRGVPLEDLRQVAYEGLVKAVTRFDPETGNDLLTYAVPSIRGEVLRHLRDRIWMIRPTRRVQELQVRIKASAERLTRENGGEPSPREVCRDLEIDESSYAEAVFGCFRPASLDRAVGPHGTGASLGDLVPDERDDLSAAEARCTLAPLLSRLGRPERSVLGLRYVEELSQREIGARLGMSQIQVSRMLRRTLAELRSGLDPDGGD